MMNFRGVILQIEISKPVIKISNRSAEKDLTIRVFDQDYSVYALSQIKIPNKRLVSEEKIGY